MNCTSRLVIAIGAFCASTLHASVSIVSLSPSLSSPQLLGTPVTWTVVATDSNAGPLTFQYSVRYEKQAFTMRRDFYPGTLSSGEWTGPAFVWQEIVEGTYTIQVIAKDFGSHESQTATLTFKLYPRSTGGSFLVSATGNALVALASAPSCPSGSSFRLTIRKQGTAHSSPTSEAACSPSRTSNMFAAGMYPSTTYIINYEVITGSTVTPGLNPKVFTTGPLPTSVSFPAFTVITGANSQDDAADTTLLHSFTAYPLNATDRAGAVVWYYVSPGSFPISVLTRPLRGGAMLTLQTGNAWNPNITAGTQFVREIDVSGNILRETNVGVIQQEVLALDPSATDFGACGAVPLPAVTGAACLGAMHHDAIRLPNGDTIVNIDIEKIFPPFTQGDTTGMYVDILGDGFIVLDQNFQVKWWFDTFQHATGAPQLDINRAAVLGEKCVQGQAGCPTLFLAGTPGVTTAANDWLHQNSIYYDPVDGDVILSSRHQDWLYKVDYANGAGTGNVLWRMGLDGDFFFNNTYQDPYPWFSHQHDAGIDNTTTGELTVFDDGNTRVAPPPTGLGSGNSRGMVLTVDESGMTVTPVLSQDLGVYSFALGSAHALSNGNFFFQPGTVSPGSFSYDIEVLPTSGTQNGTLVYELQSGVSYRAWLMPSLYFPPAF